MSEIQISFSLCFFLYTF